MNCCFGVLSPRFPPALVSDGLRNCWEHSFYEKYTYPPLASSGDRQPRGSCRDVCSRGLEKAQLPSYQHFSPNEV